MAIRSTTQNLYVRLEDDELAAVKELARANDRTIAAELRRAVRFYLRARASGQDDPR